jgi:hypothetical protein
MFSDILGASAEAESGFRTFWLGQRKAGEETDKKDENLSGQNRPFPDQTYIGIVGGPSPSYHLQYPTLNLYWLVVMTISNTPVFDER